MPSLRTLECLLAVLDTGSVSSGAERLHLSQPALSHQLANLERELETRLLERRPRAVTPTAAGRAMAADACVAVETARRAAATARAVAAGSASHLRLGGAESLTAAVLGPALHAWHRRHSGVRISLDEMTSANALNAALAENRLDLVVSPRPDAPAGASHFIGPEDVVVAMSSEHRFARRRASPSFADVAAGLCALSRQ